MTLLCLGLRENYPFSHFPMFSSFSNRTYFIHLADAQGRELKTRQFGLSNSGMKKIFDRLAAGGTATFRRCRKRTRSLWPRRRLANRSCVILMG